MNDTVRRTGQNPATRNPADLAPSVERDWSEAFILEQRLLGVSGRRIGDGLVTVEAHAASPVRAPGRPSGTPPPTRATSPTGPRRSAN